MLKLKLAAVTLLCSLAGAAFALGDPQRRGLHDWIAGLRVGSLRQRNDLVPREQYWRRSAQSWIDNVGDIPKFDTE